MRKRTFSNIKKKMAILMLVLYLISMIAVAVSIGTSNSANIGSKDSGKLSENNSRKSSENINRDGQRGNVNIPHIKGNANNSTVTTTSTAA